MQSDKSGQMGCVWRKSFARHIIFCCSLLRVVLGHKKIDCGDEKYQFLRLSVTLPFYDLAQVKQDQTTTIVQPGPPFVCLHHQLNLDQVTNKPQAAFPLQFCFDFYFNYSNTFLHFSQHNCEFYPFLFTFS